MRLRLLSALEILQARREADKLCQEEWERAAFQAGGGGFLAPAQRVEDFLKKRPSQGPGAIRPTYRPGVTWTELDRCLPGAVADTLRGALP